jgi:hypothetical protein
MDQSSSSSSSSAAAAALNIPNVINNREVVSSPPFVFYRLSSVGKALLSCYTAPWLIHAPLIL